MFRTRGCGTVRATILFSILVLLFLLTPIVAALGWDSVAWEKAKDGRNSVVVNGSEEQTIYDGGTTAATYSLTNWDKSTMSVKVVRKVTATSLYSEIVTLAPGESVDVWGYAIKVQGTSAKQTDTAGVFYRRV